MNSIDLIKNKIKMLYENNGEIHINVAIKNPKINLYNVPASIIGVYPHVFRLEDKSSAERKFYTLQYSDILTGQICITDYKLKQ